MWRATVSCRRRRMGCWRCRPRDPALVPELLAQHALFETGAGVEQQRHLMFPVLADHDLGDVLELDIVGDGADRTLLRLAGAEGHDGIVAEDGAAPAPRPER